MIIELTETTTSAISQALLRARQTAGIPAMGMVMTTVVVCDEELLPSAMNDVARAAQEHPARILFVVISDEPTARLNAEVRIGDGEPGEIVILRLSGPVASHAAGVVLPLLLPDAPVVVWWAGSAPDVPVTDPVGMLGNRRITDAADAEELRRKAKRPQPGDSDLAWTRLTPWRALLAAALDQQAARQPSAGEQPAGVTQATVRASPDSGPAALLAAWLTHALRIPVSLEPTPDPELAEVRLGTPSGEIVIRRIDDSVAQYTVPGQPQREVALRRRPVAELLAEELRRLDPDEIYSEVLATLRQLPTG